MSLAGVHTLNTTSPLLNALGLRGLSIASSLDKLANYDNLLDIQDFYHSLNSETVMTIEQIRSQLYTCFTCGVSWADEHVSLDCSECAGYALDRPCVECDGKCGAIWKRDITTSHATSKARWIGECAEGTVSSEPEGDVNANTRQTLGEICQRFEANDVPANSA